MTFYFNAIVAEVSNPHYNNLFLIKKSLSGLIYDCIQRLYKYFLYKYSVNIEKSDNK